MKRRIIIVVKVSFLNAHCSGTDATASGKCYMCIYSLIQILYTGALTLLFQSRAPACFSVVHFLAQLCARPPKLATVLAGPL